MSKLRKLINCSMNLQKFWIVCFLAAFPLLLSGCNFVNSVSETSTTTPLHADQSITSGEPCKGPCWYGVIVGQSKIEELQAILPTLEFVDEGSIKVQDQLDRDGKAMRSTYWNCQFPTIKVCGFADFEAESGTIIELVLNLGYDVSLSDLIIIHGNPDEVSVFRPLTAGEPICTLSFLWKGLGISASSDVVMNRNEPWCASNLKSHITSQMLINTMIYSSTEHFSNVCMTEYCIPWEDVSLIEIQ